MAHSKKADSALWIRCSDPDPNKVNKIVFRFVLKMLKHNNSLGRNYKLFDTKRALIENGGKDEGFKWLIKKY